ncbi:hypothetical protein G9A89_009298 [Geosiphon pyriformis]|nr:hypothetical protein G9A89_009298 [Geosiphon pyriformis]
MPPTATIYNSYTHHIPQQSNYQWPKLVCVNCSKKLLSISVCCGDDEEYYTATKFYCCPCIFKCFEQPKRQGKWNNQSCLACGETLLDEGMWNNISGRGGTCDIRKETPIEAAWRRAMQQLDSCPHDDDKIWRMAIAKIEGATPKEIREIKNNSPEPIELD